jgi:hypothetical protein
LNPNQGDEQTKRITELTKVYEEVLEIRKQLGMAD